MESFPSRAGIARELQLELYRIDLTRVVIKNIGETKKNLSRIFTEGAASGAILFFDEAEAAFGKRSEVTNDGQFVGPTPGLSFENKSADSSV